MDGVHLTLNQPPATAYRYYLLGIKILIHPAQMVVPLKSRIASRPLGIGGVLFL